jgi:uncharacterized protein YndB with AHSA1/START domain
MTITSVHKDPEALTMTISAQYDAPIERVWSSALSSTGTVMK